jgi:hypothetical protein
METSIVSEVQLIGKPQEMLDAARGVAEVLVKLVRERNLAQKFGKKEHLFVEAWQTVGHFYGVTGKIVSVEDWTDETTGEQGFKAQAHAIHVSTGRVVSEAWAICLNNEDNWSSRPKYEYPNGVKTQVGSVLVPRFQLMSMAQTRALSKVLRNVFAFVVVLAGFDPTPAEEMTGTERTSQDNGHSKEEKKEGPKRITDNQRKRIFGIGHSKNVPMPEIVKILKKHGFDQAFQVTVDKYDAVCKDIEEFKV